MVSKMQDPILYTVICYTLIILIDKYDTQLILTILMPVLYDNVIKWVLKNSDTHLRLKFNLIVETNKKHKHKFTR